MVRNSLIALLFFVAACGTENDYLVPPTTGAIDNTTLCANSDGCDKCSCLWEECLRECPASPPKRQTECLSQCQQGSKACVSACRFLQLDKK